MQILKNLVGGLAGAAETVLGMNGRVGASCESLVRAFARTSLESMSKELRVFGHLPCF